jgi:thiamine transport system permease protein
MHHKPILRFVLFLLPAVFLALFYLYPLGNIVVHSFMTGGSRQPGGLSTILSNPIYLRILWFTTWQAALSTVLTLLLALPGAYVFTHFRFFGKNVLQALLTVPFVLPTIVTAAAFRALLGSNGLLNGWLVTLFDLQTPPIQLDQTVYFFLLAHIFYNYSLVVRIVSSFWTGLDRDLGAAARMLGASPWKTFLRVTLPLLMPAIGSSAILVFIFCFTSFGVILILGGPGYATLEVEIYRQAIQLFNLPMAAVLSLIQLAVNFLLMWVYAVYSKKSQVTFYGDGPQSGTVVHGKTATKLFVTGNICLMVLLLVSPVLGLVVRSFTGEHGLTLNYYIGLFTTSSNSVFFVEPIRAVTNSVGFALSAMCVAVLLGLLAALFLSYGKNRFTSLWDALLMLPLATSAVTLGFGFIISLNRPPLNLRDSLAMVPVAHALVAFPFVVRCILPAVRAIPQNLREAATLLGASPLQVWHRVDLPIISRAILIGAVFAFSISMGEFGASTFITRTQTPTLPVAIFRFLSLPGDLNYGQAMAMSTILMVVTCASFLILGKFDKSAKNINTSL